MRFNIKGSKFIFLLALAALSTTASALACPRINGLIDLNCDGKVKIAATGDSIVRGVGDNIGTPDSSGWVFRLKEFFPDAKIRNIGVSGTTSQRLRRLFIKNVLPGKEAYNELDGADYILIEVGTNEYWDKLPISHTVVGIKRLIKTLKSFYSSTFFLPEPIVVVATPPVSRRSFQNPFLENLAEELLALKNKLNVLIKFHELGEGIIGKDALHPGPSGYAKMAKLVSKVVTGKLQQEAEDLRPDSDGDGIFDLFEPAFGTDPTLPDSDSDGALDGTEIFVSFTDPLDPLSY